VLSYDTQMGERKMVGVVEFNFKTEKLFNVTKTQHSSLSLSFP
jgi:hypothetical protein